MSAIVTDQFRILNANNFVASVEDKIIHIMYFWDYRILLVQKL